MHPTSKLLQFAAAVFTAIVVSYVQLALSEVISCDSVASNTSVCVESNQTYTLTNCTVRTEGASPVFLLFVLSGGNFSSCNTSSDDPTETSNVAIIVTGGNVWPRFEITSELVSTVLIIANISIVVKDARIGINATEPVHVDPLPPFFSLLRITPNSSINISNIMIYVENTTAAFNFRAQNQNTSAAVPLLHIRGARSGSTNVDDIAVTVLSSNLSCSLMGNGGPTTAGFVMLSVAGGYTRLSDNVVSNITFEVQQSIVSLLVNSSAATDIYTDVDPTIFLVSAETNSARYCELRCIRFSARHFSKLFVDDLFPARNIGSNSASDVAAIVRWKGFANFDTTNVVFVNSVAGVRSRCGSSCSDADPDINPRSRVFELDAIEHVAYVKNCGLVATNSTLISESPRSALVFSVKDANISVNLLVRIINCSLDIFGGNLSTNSTRSLSLISVNVDLLADVQLLVMSLRAALRVESGGAATAVVSTLIDFMSRGSNVSISVADVNMSSIVTGATNILVNLPKGDLQTIAPLLTSSALVITSTLISLTSATPSAAAIPQELNITVQNSFLRVQHSLRFPNPAPFFAFVVSIAAILNSIQSLQNSSIVMKGLQLVRTFEQMTQPWFHDGPPTTFNFLPFAVRFNITAHINLLDQSALLDAVPLLQSDLFAPIVKSITNGSSLNVTYYQTHTDISQCSIHVSPSNIALSTSDSFLFVTLPSVATNCIVHVTNLNNAAASSNDERWIGAPFGSLGAASVTDTQLTVRRANLTMLLFGVLANIYFSGKLVSYTIQNAFVESFHSPLQNMSMFVFGLANSDVKFTVTLPLASSLSFISIADSTFTNFTALFMPNAMQIGAHGSPKYSMRLLDLGCNLWNGSTMSIDALGLMPSQRLYISYPRSYFVSDSSHQLCIGYRQPHSSTLSRSVSRLLEPAEDVLSSAITSSMTSVATSVAGIVGALSGDSSFMDAQTLVGLGQSSCAPQQLKDSTSTSQFLLSPFYPLGDVGIVLGNVGLFCVLHGLHRLLLMVSRRRSAKVAHHRSNALFPQLRSGNVDFHRGDGGVSAEKPALTVATPEVASKFPNHSILAAILLLPGVIHGGTRGLFSGDVIGSVVGVVAVIAVTLCVWWRVRTGRSQLVLRMKFVAYKMKVIKDFIVPWALPLGYWGPERYRAMFGRLRGPVRGGAEWLAAHSQFSALIVQFVSSIPVPQSWCTGLWFVLVGVYVVSSVVVVYFRPSRAPLSDVLVVVAHTASGTVALLAGVKSIVGQDSSDSDALVTALLVASFVSMAISLLNTVHSVVMFVWEQRQQQLQLSLAPERNAVSSEIRASGNPTRGLRLLSRQGASIGHIRSFPVVVDDMLFAERPQKEKIRLLVEMVCTRET